jgi:hypothetical protein
MTKSELIELIARKQPQLSYKDIELVPNNHNIVRVFLCQF